MDYAPASPPRDLDDFDCDLDLDNSSSSDHSSSPSEDLSSFSPNLTSTLTHHATFSSPFVTGAHPLTLAMPDLSLSLAPKDLVLRHDNHSATTAQTSAQHHHQAGLQQQHKSSSPSGMNDHVRVQGEDDDDSLFSSLINLDPQSPASLLHEQLTLGDDFWSTPTMSSAIAPSPPLVVPVASGHASAATGPSGGVESAEGLTEPKQEPEEDAIMADEAPPPPSATLPAPKPSSTSSSSSASASSSGAATTAAAAAPAATQAQQLADQPQQQQQKPLLPSQHSHQPSTALQQPCLSDAATTNLVAKDAIIASASIPTLITPSLSTPASFPPVQLLVLGVPVSGAKSRVETQIKISLVLVAQKVKSEEEGAGMSGVEGGIMASDGGLNEGVGERLARVGSWSHIRLPKLLALKKKNKKQVKPDPPAEDTLYLDVAVVRGSEPHDEIFICTGCQQRERKRAQRKKDARGPPPGATDGTVAGAAAAAAGAGTGDEKRKVVVFNCADVVEFSEGEVVLPTRITCYCRHHKERKGFSVGFSLRNAAGQLIASGATPPIMITDDHKTSMRPSNSSSTPSFAIPANPPSISSIAPLASSSSNTTVTAASSQRDAANAASAAASTASAAGSSRPPSRRPSPTPSAASPDVRPKRTLNPGGRAKPTPYDSSERPRKRPSTAGVHKSPSFAMTPLMTPSKPGSPVASPGGASLPPISGIANGGGVGMSQQQQQQQQLQQQMMQYHQAQAHQQQHQHHHQQSSSSSALGLGGMDMYMGDASTSGAMSYPFASAQPSSAPSPSSAGWRSAASSPPLSTSNSVDNFASFFSGLTSPEAQATRSGTVSPLLMHNQDPAESFASLYTNGLASIPTSAPPQAQPQHTMPVTASTPITPAASLPSTLSWFPAAPPPPPPPRISRLIPGEGPVHGGIEVTILGENFIPDLVCVFGDAPAVPTHYWSANTLVCVLPPSANPGPVVVGIKGVPLTVEQGTGLQLFTYKDDSDRSLLELALQVVGLKMTGRLEDASAVAMRIIGTNPASAAAGSTTSPHGSHHASPVDMAGLALQAGSNFAASSSSRSPSRRASTVPGASFPSLTDAGAAGETRNFEGIVIKFLSLLDLEASAIPGAAPSLPSAQPPISHVNAQRHTLLHLATVLGFHRLAGFLVARGIALNQPDRNGYTALHFAALYGRVAITRMLLEAGAASYVRNLAGKTALEIAQHRDDVDVEEVFHRLRPSQRAAPAQRPASALLRSALPSSPAKNYYSSDDDDSDDDTASFHSSDEEESDSDLERGHRFSRNPSMVSLHYLLEAEADVYAQYGSGGPASETDDDLDSESEESEEGTPRLSADVSSFPDDKKVPLDDATPPPQQASSPTTTVRDYAFASGAWLANLKPALHQFAPPKLPLTTNLTDVWEKMQAQANPVWERMNHPLQAWYAPAPRQPGTITELDGEQEQDLAGPASESKAWMPYWRQPKSPPPMYTVADTLHPSPPVTPQASVSALSPTPTVSKVQARSEQIADAAVQSLVQHGKRLRDDRMLTFFWVPVLLIVTTFFFYNYTHLIYQAIDLVAPSSLLRALRN